MEKCRRMKSTQCTSKNWIYSWQWKSSRIRQQSYRSRGTSFPIVVPDLQLLQQNAELREAHHKSLNEMEELKKFQCSTFDTFARRRLVEHQDTILKLSDRVQELQNEVHCMKRFKGFPRCWINTQWKFPRYQSSCVFPTHPIPARMLSYSIGMPSRNDKSPDIWGHAWIFDKTF